MIDHFALGWVTPILSFLLSCAGCAVGLTCTARARVAHGFASKMWLGLGAISIGGTGIWTMHFVAMLGFYVRGTETRFDVPLTFASGLLAIVVVGLGLFIVRAAGVGPIALLAGGLVTGLGIAAMHYLGMRALHVGVEITYDTLTVVLSVIIAVVAATAALWLSAKVHTVAAGAIATVVMGIAVSGMHYTGMAAMRAEETEAIVQVTSGIGVGALLGPLIIGVTISTIMMLLVVGLAPSPQEMEAQEKFKGWQGRQDELQRENAAARRSQLL
ncbi:MHYT domain-containing protein [Promicromonospora kroppenstedtii]|uniref:MHYT domain-containing protein n=1 Tax=Promicromonospora kroppenstedtii TaxID=440482 RepID=A0ABW7XFL8_9MICO